MKENNVIEFTGSAHNNGNCHTMTARMNELKSSLMLKKLLGKTHA